jgi:outer membrane receptor protein involved in Fe transport
VRLGRTGSDSLPHVIGASGQVLVRRRARPLVHQIIVIALLLTVAVPLGAQTATTATVAGRVSDAATGEPVVGAQVLVEGTDRGTLTDAAGAFVLTRIPAGPAILVVRSIGYAAVRIPITASAGATLRRDVQLTTTALELEGITVTADPLSRAAGELGTASVVGRDAIRHQTVTTLAGVLELVPGVTMSPPGLGGVQQVALRSAPTTGTRSGELAAFGTLIVLDGIPASNNVNLQTLGPGFDTDLATAARGGVDLRRIPAATIERVEVIRGVPSARYGDLTQGAIVVETRTGAFDPEVALQYDARGTNLAFSAGRPVAATHTATATLDLARYAPSPGDRPDRAHRFAGQIAHRVAVGGERVPGHERIVADTRLDLFQIVDDRPERPETETGFASSNRDSGFRLSQRSRLRLGSESALTFTGALVRERQRSFQQQFRVAGAMPFTDRLVEGRSVGRFIGGRYLSELAVDGDPSMAYARLEANVQREFLGFAHEIRPGLEVRREWNAGAGYQFDMEFPPQVSFTGIEGFARPRRFSDVPAIATSAVYIDDRASRALPGGAFLNVQAGLRFDVLHEGGAWTSAARDALLQPRLNLELGLRDWLRLRGGFGRTAKVPPLALLHPAPAYYDLVNVNWYADDPAERLAVLTTHVLDPTNPDLGLSVAEKREVGLELGIGATTLALVGFRERVTGGVGYQPEAGWMPRDRFALADTARGTGRPPTLIEPPIGTDTVPVLIPRPANDTEIRTHGFELTAQLPEIPRLRTRIQAQASWIETREESESLDFGGQLRFREFQLLPQRARTPFWDSRLRSGRSVLATYRVIHHQPALGLVVTGTIQHNVHDRVWDDAATDSLAFAGFMTRDGQLVRVPPEQRAAAEYSDLRVPRSGGLVNLRSAPADWMLSLQVTKSLPLDGRLSFWAFNALDRRGYFLDTDTAQRLYPPLRFGMEVSVSPRVAMGAR